MKTYNKVFMYQINIDSQIRRYTGSGSDPENIYFWNGSEEEN